MATAQPQEPERVKETVIRNWVAQIMSNPIILDAVLAGGQVEVRLFAHRGQVRKDPVILLNAGPSSMV